ncbi:endonuclease [bacterium]|nr:endonuclease [bacterium]
MTVSLKEAYFVPNRAFIPAQRSLFKSADAPPDTFLATPGEPPGLIPRPLQGPLVRPYYDNVADAKLQESYYQSLELSANGQEAFDQLSKLVKDTHTTQLNYAPEKYVYPWVELRPNGQIESIYSPDSVVKITPAKTAAVDAAMAQMASFAPLAPETVAAHMTLTQVAGSLNCEHVVPQSWYDAKEPMRGDLHHLFACDSRCNSFRGNRAYHESTGASTDTVARCGVRTDEDKGFQPMAGHGAVARATLYFLLRYPKKASAYGADDIATLVKWSQKEPPSLYEKHRNAAIQELQGNRNPFIDHPEWVSKVDFGPGVRKRPVQEE